MDGRVTRIVGAFLILLQLHAVYGRQPPSSTEIDYVYYSSGVTSESKVVIPGAGVNHVVGGALGWFVSRLEGATSFYQDWATNNGPFRVGDTIEFRYMADDVILQVDAADFITCLAVNTLATYTGGSSVVPLTKAMPMYFISKNTDYCNGGLKVSINVVA